MRIVLTGAESSGKSTLAEQLSLVLNIPFAPEYARIYLEQNGPDYDLAQLTHLSVLHQAYQQTQVPLEAPLGIYDTDLINYKIWAEVVFGVCPRQIREAAAQESDHVYLLCNPDLPWEPDPLRENPRADEREWLYQRHLSEIQRLNRRYEVVEGVGEQRLINAQAAFEQLLLG
ncbi:ATPase [Amphritea opalescens]|uniref:ATPase n=1 Tax=Amphritea opalescens TaxID=2490544 RepID=A0A430KS73_9GAMM|nr:ATP-binding protein [Amphritea opalescens]RTE66352.1 ATPase [Amphritea opalescens]